MVLKGLLRLWHRYENLSMRIALILIGLQVVHLLWLTTDVVLPRALGAEPFFPDVLVPLLVLVDYLEIPALVAGITFYSLLHKKNKAGTKNALFLAMLSVQVFHIFWITDEVVYRILFEQALVSMPTYLAWMAIMVDYLELPVIGDLMSKFARGKRR